MKRLLHLQNQERKRLKPKQQRQESTTRGRKSLVGIVAIVERGVIVLQSVRMKEINVGREREREG